ncbi:hypothetical protein CWO07_17760 [Vibrio splendidus]|uniref:Haloacid dehalogenase-like hydrolase n=1 Tax=Vibrio splendidus TaxID=29497 RepID=A0A2T5ESG5_VIBSP|nr:HAD-IB family phosphatase [Vibrio splendidus]PTP29359.1 hypothetical protein CWO07_17760 [Vibrio splendidus]
MKIAVFDVCGTIYRSNTTFEFLDHYFANNYRYRLFRFFSRTFFAKLINYPFFKYFRTDLIRIIAILFLKGESTSAVSESARLFVEQQLNNKVQQPVADLFGKYKREGYYLVLMSGSLDFLITTIQDKWEADDAYSTLLQRENNKFTGSVYFDQLFNKYDVLKNNYKDIEELVVVSDNASDLLLLSKADTAFAICNKQKHIDFWKRQNLSNLSVVDLS